MADQQEGLVSGVRYFIANKSGPPLELKHVMSHQKGDGQSGQHVLNAYREVIGIDTSGGGYTITLKVRSTQLEREVDWVRMRLTGVRFRFDIQTGLGYMDQYERCKVVTVNDNGGDGGYSMDVTIMAETMNPMKL